MNASNHNSNHHSSAPLRALIMTIGIPSDPREDIAVALLEEIIAIAPEVTHLVASPESVKNAKRLAELAAAKGRRVDISPLASAHDLQETFLIMNKMIGDALAQGLRRDEIAINFTSGTKMMGLGAALSGVFNRIQELRYITGVAPGQNRKRRLIKAEPGAIFAAQDLLRARTQTMELRFGSAQALLRGINETLLDDSERRERTDLIRLSRAYAAWDSFHPAGFLDDYAEVDFSLPANAAFKLADDQVAEIKALAAEMQRGFEDRRFIVDLYNNGLRRFQSGQIDDAVIRLYRAMEALAQWVLRRDYGADMNDLEVRKAPPRERARFEALRSIEDGRIKLDMRRAYELLALLGSKLGEYFAREKGLEEFLDRSDVSILTRGLKPISEVEARKLFEITHGLIEVEIEDFHQIRKRLQFPWIDEGEDGPWNCPMMGSKNAHIQPAAKDTLK